MFKIQENILLSSYTNYKIGGPARYFCNVNDKEEIKKALTFAKDKNIPIFILGGGTNILISDQGFDGLVIKLNFSSLKIQDNRIKAGAGIKLSNLVKTSLKNGLSGLEWAMGIPGTVGGAVRGNAGAFGESIADNIESVEVINTQDLNIEEMKKGQLGFDYRTSLIKKRDDIIVLNVNLKLKKTTDKENIEKNKQKVQKNISYRKENHPLDYPSCGSVFKSAKKGEKIVSAGKLIEQTGLSGKKIGNAQISEKHANFIINLGNATAEDVYSLIKMAQEAVYKKFKVKLEPEVELIGF